VCPAHRRSSCKRTGLSAPQVGVMDARPEHYGERVTRISPFDNFVRDAGAWLDSAWYLWILIPLLIAGIVAIVTVSKARARARARVPQYRRQLGS